MTEQEYISATNLGKLIVVQDALRNVMPDSGFIDGEELRALRKEVSSLCDKIF